MGYRLHIFLLRNYLPRMFSVCMCAGLQVSVSVLLFLFANPVPPRLLFPVMSRLRLT